MYLKPTGYSQKLVSWENNEEGYKRNQTRPGASSLVDHYAKQSTLGLVASSLIHPTTKTPSKYMGGKVIDSTQ